MTKRAKKVMIFKRFERFWHWAQAALIMVLLFSGFEIHGSYRILGFEDAVTLHRAMAWSLVTLWVFAIFWHLTTGEWKQYIPTLKKVDAMVKYYLLGIFIRAPHPFRQTMLRKHNPLQRLAYLFMWVVISPIIWATGWAYLFYAQWADWGLDQYLKLEDVAFFHAVGAFMMLTFLIAHLYLITTGKTVWAHMRAMITGWEEIDPNAKES
ncbi:MAG: cytochrome b/b6 domain-containing protein [Gammaproteobacteria bacterium]|nr:cytochrome b/b6 domain-containing protein [Gammaproteobacteria bacterium]MBT8134042.1 cytochrome b/b6 domain-containing protein [Gammaproteobacteria bacterium]NNJ49853.1 cytochrome B [Gammaproteobacteria bacterium]